MRALIVDDDADILEIISLGLEVVGAYEIETAQSGMRALELINQASQPFDLLLLDIQMPEMTGIELCKQIRQHPDYRFKPIIMVTAMSQKPYIDRAFAIGATDYLMKPIDFADLKLRVGLAETASFRAEKMAQDAQAQASNLANRQPKISISDAIPIDDVDGVLRVYAFENYLAQLNRLAFSATHLYVLTISNIASIHGRCQSREFVDEIADIAECISDALRDLAPMITYFGGGIFGFATRGHNVAIEEMRSRIYWQIEETGLVFRDGCPVSIEFDLVAITRKAFLSSRSQSTFLEKVMGDLKLAAHSKLGLPEAG